MALLSPLDALQARNLSAQGCFHSRHRLVFALVAIVGLASSLFGARSLKVEYVKGNLSVQAETTSLADVLREVSLRTGIQVLGAQELGRPVSVDFSGVPVDQALATLLAGTDYALIGNFAPGLSMHRARVVILTGKPATPFDFVATGAGAAGTTVTQAQRNAARAGLMSENPVEQDAGFRQLAKASPKEVLDALEDVLTNGEGLARLRALQFLDQDNRIDPAASLGVLRSALNDPDLTLRDYAIQALGRREGSESIEILRQLFNDGDTSVRLSVVESVGQRDDARPLLQQASSDPDQAVSNLANELLGNSAPQPDTSGPNPNPQPQSQPEPEPPPQPEPQPQGGP